MNRDLVENALAKLNWNLREKLLDTRIITVQQWNSDIAPSLSKIAMAIEGVSVTARTYRLPGNYFDPCGTPSGSADKD